MLTKRQKQVLEYIKNYIDKHEYAPSLEEIKKHLRLSSVSTAHYHVQALQDMGYLQKEINQPRAIDVVGHEAMLKIPLLGTIAAGRPIEAIQEKETIAVPTSKLPQSSDIYALRVVGNSMIDENINDGDVILVKHQETAENGQKVVALVDNYSATLKKYYRERGHIRLQPANRNMEPMIFQSGHDVAIQGIVLDVIKALPTSSSRISTFDTTEKNIINSVPIAYLRKVSGFGQRTIGDRANILVLGDNAQVLKSFLDNALICGKVNLIYIDPPFATNQIFRGGINRTATISRGSSDKIAYHDKLTGAEYIEFLRTRLILMREILSNNGSIYIHIDLKMGHYVKVLMDEVFGRDMFINDITRIKCSPKNFSRKGYGNIKDMILFYSKTKKYVWNEPREKMSADAIKRLFSKTDKNGRRYTTTPLHAPGETINGDTGKKWKGLTPPPGRHWRYSPDELTRLDNEGLIEWSATGNPRKIIYADEIEKNGKKIQDIWELKDPVYPQYPTEKNLDMLKKIISASSNKGDIVMDSFCGSGSTLLAAEMLGRQWIGIDNSRIAISVSEKRLKKYKDISYSEVFNQKET
ncbi:MAG: transcriptional repressor LexA [Candidatus Omnitrophota bacterium]